MKIESLQQQQSLTGYHRRKPTWAVATMRDITSFSLLQCVKQSVWSRSAQRRSHSRDVMFAAGPHLSGLSDAQTESIIPTSSVPWRDREGEYGSVTAFRVWIMSSTFFCPAKTNYLSHTHTHTHALTQRYNTDKRTGHLKHICFLSVQHKVQQQSRENKTEQRGAAYSVTTPFPTVLCPAVLTTAFWGLACSSCISLISCSVEPWTWLSTLNHWL